MLYLVAVLEKENKQNKIKPITLRLNSENVQYASTNK